MPSGNLVRLIILATCIGACTSKSAHTSPIKSMRLEADQVVAEGVVRDTASTLGSREPTFVAPATVRLDPSQHRYWLLDTGRGTVFEFDSTGTFMRRVGRKGYGRGELSIPIAMDVSPSGTVWIVDAGNAKVVGFRADGTAREIAVNFKPAGVAAISDNDVWVAGDLQYSMFVRFDSTGRRTGTVGAPVDSGSGAFRSNQGTAIRGTGKCAALWAYVYRSIIECYDSAGYMVWRSNGPIDVAWPEDANRSQMGVNDVTAYNDIATAGDTIYALFVGRPGPPATRIVQRFRVKDGGVVPSVQLPALSTHIAIGTSRVAALESGSNYREHLHIYRRAR